MPLVSGELRDKRIDDLLRARPQGPIGRKVSYVVESKWSNSRGKHVDIPVPSHDTWGYTDEEIYSLGLYSREDVEQYALKRWWGDSSKWGLGRQKATFTRRVNRLWENRIEDIVDRVKRAGGDGIYQVTLGRRYYSSSQELGHIYASNKEEAQRFADMFFSYLCENEKKVQIHFIRFGKPNELIALNAKTISRAADKIKECKARIAQLNELIEKQSTYLETLSMVQEQQLSAEG